MVHLAYACQPVRVEAGDIEEHFIAVMPEPGRPKMFAVMGYENGTAMFGVGTMAGLEPPRTTAEMVAFAADFAPTRTLVALAEAEPLGEVAHYRVPSNRWRRYDKMRRFPAGLITFGDAICSFNPIYGQGMTVAAVESLILRECLRDGDRDLPRRFFRSSAKKIRIAWQSAVGSDLALPEVEGRAPLSMRLSNMYLDRVMAAAESDPTVMMRFLRVIGMIDSPAKLLSPSFAFRVLGTQRDRYRPAHRQPATHGDAVRRDRPRQLGGHVDHPIVLDPRRGRGDQRRHPGPPLHSVWRTVQPMMPAAAMQSRRRSRLPGARDQPAVPPPDAPARAPGRRPAAHSTRASTAARHPHPAGRRRHATSSTTASERRAAPAPASSVCASRRDRGRAARRSPRPGVRSARSAPPPPCPRDTAAAAATPRPLRRHRSSPRPAARRRTAAPAAAPATCRRAAGACRTCARAPAAGRARDAARRSRGATSRLPYVSQRPQHRQHHRREQHHHDDDRDAGHHPEALGGVQTRPRDPRMPTAPHRLPPDTPRRPPRRSSPAR